MDSAIFGSGVVHVKRTFSLQDRRPALAVAPARRAFVMAECQAGGMPESSARNANRQRLADRRAPPRHAGPSTSISTQATIMSPCARRPTCNCLRRAITKHFYSQALPVFLSSISDSTECEHRFMKLSRRTAATMQRTCRKTILSEICGVNASYLAPSNLYDASAFFAQLFNDSHVAFSNKLSPDQ